MKSTIAGVAFLFFGILTTEPGVAQIQSVIFSGAVDRVWEDGFQMNNGDRSITVDAYDICGDNTTRHIAVGEQVTVTGEFEGEEFDAFSIEKASGESVCSVKVPED